MTAMTEPGARQKFLIVALLVLFALIVLAALGKRISEPSLVQSSFGRAEMPPPQMPAPEMSAIGRLMNEAAQHPRDQAVLLKVAEGLLSQGQPQAAEEFARRVLSLESDNARALHLMGIINHQRGSHDKAAEFLEKSVAAADNAAARYSLGVLYTHFLNDKQKGAENFKKALADPAIAPGLKQAVEQELAKIGN